MRQFILVVLAAGFVFGCVPRDQYNAATAELAYYRNEAAKADSLETYNSINAYNNEGATDLETQRLIQEVEQLRATNISLNQSFQDLTARFDEQVQRNIELTNATGNQVTDLQQSLADRTAQLSQQEQLLREKEIELYSREQQLATIAPEAFDPNASTPATYGNSTPNSLDLNQQAAIRQNQLQSELRQALGNYAYTDVRYGLKASNGVMLTLSQAVLFSDGYQLSDGGRDLVARIATVLQRFPDAKIRVVGHSDPAGSPVMALENSTDRAISITQYLVSRGINARNVLAAGQGYYNPLTNDNSTTGQAENRRTDIVIELP